MAIRKKSNEELQAQAVWFLTYEESLWNITQEKKEEILWALSLDSTEMHKESDLKNSFNWFFSDPESENLQWEYTKFSSRMAKLKTKVQSLFPAWYEFLGTQLIVEVLKWWENIEWLEKEVNDLLENEEELKGFKDTIKGNIDAFHEALNMGKEDFENLRDEHLQKMLELIINWDPERIKTNIGILRDAWITKIDDFVKLRDVIKWWDAATIEALLELWGKNVDDLEKFRPLIPYCDLERVKTNIGLLKSSWITKIDDFIKLKEIIRYRDVETVKKKLEILKYLWITDPDDFLKLRHIISSGEQEKVKENMEALRSIWITEIDDFKKIRNIIRYWDTEVIKTNTEALRSVWITNIDDLVKLQDIMYRWDPEKIKINIEALKKVWITNIDDLVKLIDVIRFWYPENIETLHSMWIKDADDFVKFQDTTYIQDVERTKKNIEALKDLGITEIADFKKVKDIIHYWRPENIAILKDLWITDVDYIVRLKDFATSWDPEGIKANIAALKSVWITETADFIKLKDTIRFSYPEKIKTSIEALQSVWITAVDDFVKVKDIIRNCDSEKIKTSIEALQSVWITAIDDFVKLTDVFRFWHPENIEALKSIWIRNVDDLIKVQDIIYRWNPEQIKTNVASLKKVWITAVDDLIKLQGVIYTWTPENIEALHSVWITAADDFAKLWTIIHYWDSEKIKANIETLKGIWITDVDDFEKLRNIISYWEPEKTKENIEALNSIWIANADDLIKLNDTIYNSDAERIKTNIGALKSAWITEIDDFVKLQDIIIWWRSENIEAFKSVGITTADDFLKFQDVVRWWDAEKIKGNIEALKNAWITKVDDLVKIKEIIYFWEPEKTKANIEALNSLWIAKIDDLLTLRYIIRCWGPEQIKSNIESLKGAWITEVADYLKLQDIICYWNSGNIEVLKGAWITQLDDFQNLYNFIVNWDPEKIKQNIESLQSAWVTTVADFAELEEIVLYMVPENLKTLLEKFWLNRDDIVEYQSLIWDYTSCLVNLSEFKEDDHKWYLKYYKKINEISRKMPQTTRSDINKLLSYISGLSFEETENYLNLLEDFCIHKGLSYEDFWKCFDWKTINPNATKFLLRWFSISGPKDSDEKFLNDSINTLYPWLNVEFNEEETEEVLWFVDSIWWINKWYSILILTIEKLLRDWVKAKDLNHMLIEKLREYNKVLDMYPEDKIPDWLKISVGIEFEMTNYFLRWYKQTTWNEYREVVNKVVENAKVWIEHEWVYEFATKPSTNPIAALLEIHLLQELNLLDINDMQKLLELRDDRKEEEKKDLVVWKADYNSRNWTGYHLNIWSDAEIWVDENIQFIQNFCTILPRWWMNNWENVSRVNGYSNINSKSSKFSVFPNSESKKYVELRTYSVDDVELFEKNVLLNTYAVMWSQAQKKVSTVSSRTVMDLRKNDTIKNAEDLMKYLVENKLFLDDQDYKSKRIAAEFIFMQIAVLRAMHDYNTHFFDNELFGINEISDNLNEPWKNYFMDLLCLDNGESIGYNDNGQSSRFVKFKCKKLYAAFHDGSFNFDTYLEKGEPFSVPETLKILDQYGESVDENKLSLVTTRLNKRLLWEKLIVWCEDTQSLEKSIADKKTNIDRIRSNIRWMDQTLKVDKEYLKEYFKTHMSLIQDNPYHWMNTDFMNKIINLNNFFLKKDDTNANWVLQKTIFEWEEEPDISKSSIFETWWYMRKWYNYYQWWTENMLLHSAQRIAINYMENIKNILNTDYDSARNINLRLDQAA